MANPPLTHLGSASTPAMEFSSWAPSLEARFRSRQLCCCWVVDCSVQLALRADAYSRRFPDYRFHRQAQSRPAFFMPDRPVSKSYLERVARVEKIREAQEVATTILLDADYTRVGF